MSHRQPVSFSRRIPWATVSGLLVGLTAGCVQYVAKPLAPNASAAALESRTFDAPGLRAFILENSSGTVPTPAGTWDLDALTLAGIYYNPGLAVARSQWKSAVAGKTVAAARPNPTVSLSGGYNQDAAAGVTPWIPGITFDLPIETAGKRAARIARADATIASAGQNLLEAAWTVRRAVRNAWLEVNTAEQRARVIEEQAKLQDHIAQLLDQRLAAGTVARSDVSSIRVAQQRAHFDEGEARRSVLAARAHLAEAIGVPLAAVRGIELSAPSDTIATPRLSAADARAWALRGRPDVLIALADYEGAEADLRQQIAKQYPDFHVGPGIQWDQGERKWSLGATLEIPVFHRNRGAILEAEAHREELAARVLAAQAKALAEVDAAFESRTQIEAQLTRAHALFDAAEEQRRIIEAARSSGDSDALQSATAKLESLNAQLTRIDTVSAWHTAYAQIEDAVRQPLPYFSRLETSPRADAPTP